MLVGGAEVAGNLLASRQPTDPLAVRTVPSAFGGGWEARHDVGQCEKEHARNNWPATCASLVMSSARWAA